LVKKRVKEEITVKIKAEKRQERKAGEKDRRERRRRK
jgi:hypothetical protein